MKDIGDRMKANYESRYKFALTRRTPVIIRVDGRAFHTLTRGFNKPFDGTLMRAMLAGAHRILNHAQGAKLAYVQSDEASFLLTDYDNLQTDAWFGYELCKLVSISASLMTQGFNQAIQSSTRFCGTLADFDSRAFNVPEAEVTNYFLWRAKDWHRNSVTMYAGAHFSHNQMHQKSLPGLHGMLHGVGKNWANDLAPMMKNGTFVVKRDGKWAEVCDIEPRFDQINPLVEAVLPYQPPWTNMTQTTTIPSDETCFILGEHIARLIEDGFNIDLGPHTDMRGYYATVFIHSETPVCDKCEAPHINDWDQAGHGWSLHEALINAEKIAKTGKAETHYEPDKFSH